MLDRANVSIPDDAPAIRLVITDLDNTLYDWVAWYASALGAMVGRACDVLGCDEAALLGQLRDAYAARGSVEEPRALLELPIVRDRFADRHAAARALEPALEAFIRPGQGTLRAYPGAVESLARLAALGVPVVGHTESTPANAVRRLRRLGLDGRLAALFAGASHRPRSDERDGPLPGAVSPPPDFAVHQLGPELAKPDPATVMEICAHMQVPPGAVLYVGDNLDRDVAMARRAGAWAAWARFGTQHAPQDWARLVRITHWSAAEVRRAEHPQPTGEHPPHATLRRSFSEIF
ncbi:MAG: HAD family hydrolase, partial [Myxococcota bacterium]